MATRKVVWVKVLRDVAELIGGVEGLIPAEATPREEQQYTAAINRLAQELTRRADRLERKARKG